VRHYSGTIWVSGIQRKLVETRNYLDVFLMTILFALVQGDIIRNPVRRLNRSLRQMRCLSPIKKVSYSTSSRAASRAAGEPTSVPHQSYTVLSFSCFTITLQFNSTSTELDV